MKVSVDRKNLGEPIKLEFRSNPDRIVWITLKAWQELQVFIKARKKDHMSTSELATAKGLDSFDTALPQTWVDEVMKYLPQEQYPCGHIVWCYRWDEVNFQDTWGRPIAITKMGEFILGNIAAAFKY